MSDPRAAPKPGTTMGRIAALEAQVAALTRRVTALEGKPPERDPASTTGGSTERAWSQVVEPKRAKAETPGFGFASARRLS